MDAAISRALIGLVVAAGIAGFSLRQGALTKGGATAAVVLGTAAMAAGYEWAGILLAFFIGSTLLGRWRASRRFAVTRSITEKLGARDAEQVVANGGIFAVAAAAHAIDPNAAFAAAGVGALVAANADTWSTEIGTVAGGTPRSLRGFRPVPAGTSGAVSLQGTVASLAGAGFLASLAIVLGWPLGIALGAAAGGVAGAAADSVAGAFFQQRRWCDACGCATERREHSCGRESRHEGGFVWMRNDAVNFVCTAVGAVVAVLLAR